MPSKGGRVLIEYADTRTTVCELLKGKIVTTEYIREVRRSFTSTRVLLSNHNICSSQRKRLLRSFS